MAKAETFFNEAPMVDAIVDPKVSIKDLLKKGEIRMDVKTGTFRYADVRDIVSSDSTALQFRLVPAAPELGQTGPDTSRFPTLREVVSMAVGLKLPVGNFAALGSEVHGRTPVLRNEAKGGSIWLMGADSPTINKGVTVPLVVLPKR